MPPAGASCEIVRRRQIERALERRQGVDRKILLQVNPPERVLWLGAIAQFLGRNCGQLECLVVFSVLGQHPRQVVRRNPRPRMLPEDLLVGALRPVAIALALQNHPDHRRRTRCLGSVLGHDAILREGGIDLPLIQVQLPQQFVGIEPRWLRLDNLQETAFGVGGLAFEEIEPCCEQLGADILRLLTQPAIDPATGSREVAGRDVARDRAEPRVFICWRRLQCAIERMAGFVEVV